MMLPAAAVALEPTVKLLRPVLNRIVFSGVVTCRGLIDVRSPRVRSLDGRPLALELHTTSSLDRLSGEVVPLGVSRASMRDGSETWTAPCGTRLRVWGIPAADSGDEAIVREYAVLLTRQFVIGGGLAIRITALPVQVALWCVRQRAVGYSGVDLPWFEDVICVVVGRRDSTAELRALPAELRAIVADAVAGLLSTGRAPWVIRRLVAEARTTPEVVGIVLKRLETVAQLPRT